MPVEELFSININYWVFQTIAMLLTALLIPGLKVTGPVGALTTVVALAFVNSKVWDAALFFQIPASISSHAIALVLANGILFWILIKILPGIEVEGFWPAIVAPLVFAACSLAISQFADQIDWVLVLETVIDLLQQAKEFLKDSAGPGAFESISSV